MATAFGVEQESSGARIERGVSNFEARPPSNAAVGTLLKGIDDFVSGLTELAEDKNLTAMGDFVAKARGVIRRSQNPVERKLLEEDYTQRFLKRFGAKHSDKISLLSAPDIEYKVDAERGVLISTDKADGKKTFTSLDKLAGTPEEEYKESVTDSFTRANVNSPTLASVTQGIFARGDMTGSDAMVVTADAVNDAHMGLQRAEHQLARIEMALMAKGIEPGPEIGKRFATVVKNNLFGALETLFHPEYQRMVSDRNNSLTANDMAQVADAMVVDYMTALRQSNLANKLQIDMREISSQVSSVRENLVKAYEAAFNKDFATQKRETDIAQSKLDFYKSEFMLDLKNANPEAWRLAQSATIVQAAANMAYYSNMADSLMATEAGSASHEAGTLMLSLSGMIHGWDAAYSAAVNLNTIGVASEQDIVRSLGWMGEIRDKHGLLVYQRSIDRFFTKNMEIIERLGKTGEISPELLNQVKAQRARWDQHKSQMQSKSKVTDEERGWLSKLLNSLRGGRNTLDTITPEQPKKDDRQYTTGGEFNLPD